MNTNKEKLKTLDNNIKVAKNYQKTDNWLELTKRLEQYCEGNYNVAGYLCKYSLNSAQGILSVVLPSLSLQELYVDVSSNEELYFQENEIQIQNVVLGKAKAELMEGILNSYIKRLKLEDQVNLCVEDCFKYGFGVIKLGVYTKTAIGNDFEDDATDFYIRRIDPRAFLFDPFAANLDESRFNIHRIVKPLELIKKNKNYKHVDKLEGTVLTQGTKERDLKDNTQDETKWIELYEYEDMLNDKLITYVDESTLKTEDKRDEGKLILWERDNPEKGKSAYCILKLAGSPDKIRGLPMLSLVEDQMLALNQVVTYIINHMQQFPGIVTYEKGALNEEQQNAWVETDQGLMLEVGEGALKEGKVIRNPPVSMGADYFMVINVFNQLIDRVLGIPDYQRAPGSGKRKTAQEVALEGSAANAKINFYLGKIQNFVNDIVTKLCFLVQEYGPEESVVTLTGDAKVELKYNKQDTKGTYKFKFDYDTLSGHQQAKFQALMNYLQVIGQNPFLQPIAQMYDPAKIAKLAAKYLKVDHELLLRDEIINPSPVPQQPLMPDLLQGTQSPTLPNAAPTEAEAVGDMVNPMELIQ